MVGLFEAYCLGFNTNGYWSILLGIVQRLGSSRGCMGFSRRDIRGEVLELLKSIYPDGLTIREIAERSQSSQP